ncbi:MAG: hypothetical protein JXR49_20600 [Acidobacteria bacterium]|nr:hypothetical protein [Acidobacteriota bacterium]
MSPGTAREAIIAPPQQLLEKDDIDIVHITQTSGSSVVVESRVKTAFRLQKVNDVWEVRDIRIGNGQWEKVEDLTTALTRVKNEQTRLLLEQVAASVEEYRRDTGKMPEFEDYVDLSDVLAPKYMKSLIRLDSWRNPLRAKALNTDSIQVISAGPDLRFNTDDDISLTINP